MDFKAPSRSDVHRNKGAPIVIPLEKNPYLAMNKHEATVLGVLPWVMGTDGLETRGLKHRIRFELKHSGGASTAGGVNAVRWGKRSADCQGLMRELLLSLLVKVVVVKVEWEGELGPGSSES